MSLDVFTGVFSDIAGGSDIFLGTSFDDLVAKWEGSISGPLALTSINTHQEDHATTWYTGVWTQISKASNDPCLWSSGNWTMFEEAHAYCSPHARLLDFDIAPGDNWDNTYTGTWGGDPIEQVLVSDVSVRDFVAEYKPLYARGLRLTKTKVHPTAGPDFLHLTGLFEKATSSEEVENIAILTTNWGVFYNQYFLPNSGRLQLVDFQVCDDDYGGRWYFGTWRQLPFPSIQQLVVEQDNQTFWEKYVTLSEQGWRLTSVARYSPLVRVPRPDWDDYFNETLSPITQGYAYIVLNDGKLVANGSYGNARDANDSQNNDQPIPFTLDTRIHLASVSKAIAATTLLKILHDKNINIDVPFWDPYMKDQIPKVGPGVANVTIRELLNMTSGMDATWDLTYFDTSQYWKTLNDYLAAQNVTNKFYVYSNTNYLILQALIDCLLGNDGNSTTQYPEYALQYVLEPMGIDRSQWTTHGDPEDNATLTYSTPASSSESGWWIGDIPNIGGGGWVATAAELAKFLAGIRNNVVLNATTTATMLAGNLGWDPYWNDCIYGNVYHKNGILREDPSGTTHRGLRTVIASLPFGYDVLLLTNTWLPDLDTMEVILNAFEAHSSTSATSSESSPRIPLDGSDQVAFSLVWPPDRETDCLRASQGPMGACGHDLWGLFDIAQKSYSVFLRMMNYTFGR